MTSRALWVLSAVAACRGNEPESRTRVLETIPAEVTTVAVADGKALGHPRFRAVVDVLRAEVPAGFDCVVDAALAADVVAAGVHASGDAVIAVATRAQVSCAALSQTADGLYVATVGNGVPATSGSVLAAPAHARAR
ncbi:MAG TPA: hypothetical protein VK427_24100, partial [Kofleriaceae bacterium]|nr:hypothetical protein [Kofleriaceae bacterium]